MAAACSIFTLVGQVQLFWTAFDPMITVVPLEVALGWHKFYFWVFQKNNHGHSLDIHLPDYFLKCQKTNLSHPNATFNGTTVTGISKAAQNNRTPHLK